MLSSLVKLTKRNFSSVKRNFSMQEIESSWANQRFDKVVMAKLGMPWADVHKYVREKDLFIAKGGNVPKEERYITKQTNYKVVFGDILCISDALLKAEKKKEREIKRAKGPPSFSKDKTNLMSAKFEDMLVFENQHVMVIDKPCGIPTQMGTGLDAQKIPSVDLLANAYLHAAGEAYLVHRLDQSTSGLMCLAKSGAMAKHLSDQMKDRLILKQYTALISGYSEYFPFPSQGVIRQSLEEPTKMWSVQDTAGGEGGRKFICSPEFQLTDKSSLDMVTFFEILKSLEFSKDHEWVPFVNKETKKEKEAYHLVRFELETGKKHQIRLACAHALGSPIVGDFKHGYDSQMCSEDLLRRSFKYTKLQERKLFQDSILLHSSKLVIPIETGVKVPKQKTFESDVTKSDISSAKAFVKVLQQLKIR